MKKKTRKELEESLSNAYRERYQYIDILETLIEKVVELDQHCEHCVAIEKIDIIEDIVFLKRELRELDLDTEK